MKNAGWKVVDSGPETRVAEFKVENPADNMITYDEAKTKALHILKGHVAPYLARIEQLENDLFAEAGALPPLKAWLCQSRRIVVTAKTKKRAMELACESRYGFNYSWSECSDDWWYHLAHEEAVWIEERDDRKQGTGVFHKPLGREEAERILALHIAPYRIMDIYELLGKVDQTSTDTGVSSEGTPYKVTVDVSLHDWDSDHIRVRAEIDDCLGWYGHERLRVYRELPQLAVAGTQWTKEGF